MTTSECACGWTLSHNLGETGGQFLCVLHVLVRHPATYQQATGRDPEEAAYGYRDALTAPGIREVL